jgi:hypothetical protein
MIVLSDEELESPDVPYVQTKEENFEGHEYMLKRADKVTKRRRFIERQVDINYEEEIKRL